MFMIPAYAEFEQGTKERQKESVEQNGTALAA